MSITLKTASGITIKINDKPFAKGGEGAVHKIISPPIFEGLCAKLYYPVEITPQRRRKIEYMVGNPPQNLKTQNHIICWAKDLLFQGNSFVGFTMPLAYDDSIQLYELCTPKFKAKHGKNWKKKFDRNNSEGIQSRLKLCTNLAAAIHSIHQLQNYVFVDLKPQNVLVTNNGKVSLIDCDSIQISRNGNVLFPAKVATPEYVPPEGTMINPSINVVPHSWDTFSLAIMFYEIIFGLHPYAATFSGRYQNSDTINAKIKSGLFVHGKNKQYIAVLPPLHKNYEIIPSKLKKLFIRAFDTGHQMSDVRPTAEEWGKTLFKLLKDKKTSMQPEIKYPFPQTPNLKPKPTPKNTPKDISTIHKKVIGKKNKNTSMAPFLILIFLVLGILSIGYNVYTENNKKQIREEILTPPQDTTEWIIMEQIEPEQPPDVPTEASPSSPSEPEYESINKYYRMKERTNLRSSPEVPLDNNNIILWGREIVGDYDKKGIDKFPLDSISIFVLNRELKQSSVIHGCGEGSGHQKGYWFQVTLRLPNSETKNGWMWGECLEPLN